ncbi:MAG TPA: folylpolyglutamate synthase/dihydrofolate synthase family protein [bacterium]|nr:folylpolyglutamate synthase/dihydrofolate synthase family protein [bacterium]
MTYHDALRYIDSLLARAQPHPGPDTIKLHRVTDLLGRLGDPHHAVPTVLIAGTKGKGSTAAMLASIMQSAGYEVGLYTKPHLVDYRERIGVNGSWISPEALAALVEEARPHVEAMERGPWGLPSYFELSVALAFVHFARAPVELAIVEVGLGGRLDPTNVADPIVSVITPIGYDHMDVLGDTLDAIAREKAGIVRDRGTVISAPQNPEPRAAIIDVCTRRSATLVLVDEAMRWNALGSTLHEQRFEVVGPQGSYGPLRLPLIGAHQRANAATAVATAEALAARRFLASVDAVRDGLAAVHWPAREEVVAERPYVVVDVAHNPASLAALRETLEAVFSGRRIILVFGMIATHDHRACTSLIAPLAETVIVTTPQHAKPLPARVLAEEVARYQARVEIIEDRPAALERALALAGPEDVVVVTGSFFLVGEVRELLQRKLASAPLPQVRLHSPRT